MKKSKILSLILALTLMIGVMLPMGMMSASADPVGNGDTITVVPPTSLSIDAGDFKAYKLFDVTVSTNATTVAGETPTINYAYTPVQPSVGDFVFYNDPSVYGTGRDADAFLSWLQAQSNNSAALTQLTADLMEFNKLTGTVHPFVPIAATQSTDDPANVEFTGLTPGYYLVVGTGTTENGVVVTSLSALVTIDPLDGDATIHMKADAPSITKEVWNHNEVTVDDVTGAIGWDNHTDVNIGDKVDFRLTSKVPEMKGYSSYTFTVSDKLDAGFDLASDFEENGVTVTIGGNDFTDFVTAVNVGQNSFTITFDPDVFVGLTPGQDIEILYSATLNKDAVIAPLSNDNQAKLTYSNNPYTNGKGDTPWTTVYVYTFRFDINKVIGNTDTGLGNAKFNVLASDDSTVLKFKLDTVNSTAAVSIYVRDDTGSAEIVTPDSGIVRILGVDAGTYYLQETTPPDGYTKLKNEIEVDITADYSADGSAVTNTVDKDTLAKSFVVPVEQVENFSGNEMPSTGGIGTTIFYVVSGIITAGLIAFLLISRKKKALSK